MKDFYLSERGLAYRTNEFVAGRETLVFVHGLSGNVMAWQPYEEALSGEFNIVTFDLRGHGLSCRPASYEEYALGFFVEDMHALLTHLQIKTCVLISHSFGTLVALEFLRAYPSLASRALFLNPTYGVTNLLRTRLTLALLQAYVCILQLVTPRPKKLSRHAYRFDGGEGDWSPHRVLPDLRTTGLRSYTYCLSHIYKTNRDKEWSELTLPVAIVHGGKDTLIPIKNAEALAKEIADAKITILPNANHIVVLNNFKEVLEAIHRA